MYRNRREAPFHLFVYFFSSLLSNLLNNIETNVANHTLTELAGGTLFQPDPNMTVRVLMAMTVEMATAPNSLFLMVSNTNIGDMR